MADDIPLTKRSIAVESSHPNQDGDRNSTETKFFPFQSSAERQQVRIDSHAAAFPLLGIGALVGALTLIALAGIILLVIQGPGRVVSDWTVHVYKTHRYVTIPKPAAWLSGILSGISVCLHIALSEGLNIAWWYHVRQENATVGDLHNIWGHGTSTWEVAKSGAKDLRNGIVGFGRMLTNRSNPAGPYRRRRHFSYMALATLFAATIPLNGFLLQNTIIVDTVAVTKTGSVKVPMLNGNNFCNVEQVFATGDEIDGGVSDWSLELYKLSQQINSKVVPITDLGTFNTTCTGQCKTAVQGMGFQVSCDESTQHYDIPLNTEDSNDPALTGMVANGTKVFNLGITYNYVYMNRVTVRTLWKDQATCTGNFTLQTCHLDLATVEYPVTIDAGVQDATQTGLRNTTLMTLDLDLLTQSPKVVSPVPGGQAYGYTYPVAGLAGLFAQTLNSSITLKYSFNQPFYNILSTGMFAQLQLATTGTFSAESDASNGQVCRGVIGNATTQALAMIHSMTFQMGVYNYLSSYGDPAYASGFFPDFISSQTPQTSALRTFQQNQYRVTWAWYFGSMAVTLVVSALILPTFWGYWRLERKTSMSPFETARAFHAPVLYQDDPRVQSKDLIKRVGNLHIHRDLSLANVPPPPAEPRMSRQVGNMW